MAFKSSTKAKKSDKISIEDLKKLFKSANEIPPVKGLKIAIKGEPKIGKTHFTLTVPGDIFVIDLEGKTPTVSRNFDEELQERAQIQDVIEYVNEVEGEVDNNLTLDAIDERIRTFVKASSSNPDYKATIVIDSGTVWWNCYNSWLNGDPKTDMNSLGKPKQPEYGKINSKMSDNLVKLRSTGWNVIITGHSYPAYVKAGEVDENKKDAKWYKGTEHWSDVVIELKKQHGKKIATIEACTLTNAVVGMTIEDPTYEKLVALLEEHLKFKIE